jgi:hypothetical protein
MHTPRAIASLLALALAGPALGSLVEASSVEDLARRSDTVVRGKVERIVYDRSADGKRIFTYAEVVPSGVWRGAAPARLTVAVSGGVVGGIGQRVIGAPTFTQGEEVVLFLSRSKWGDYRVRGLGQGKFSVVAGQARPHLEGLSLSRRSALRAGERGAEPMAVEELERRVRAAR